MKITVVGGGNGAFAVSADLALQGHEVTLLESPQFETSIEKIRDIGGIELTSFPSSGRANGFAKLAGITTHPDKALQRAELVFVVVPAYTQKNMAEFCAPYLRKEQTVCLMPGNLYGSIEFLQTLRRYGNSEVEAISEIECLIYTATRTESGVGIRGFKQGLGLSVFPARCSDSAKIIQSVYPTLKLRKNILATGVSNPNILLHVPLVLLNFTNIERGADLLSFHTTFTQGVARLVDSLDAERMQLAERGIADIVTTGEMVRSWYSAQGAHGATSYEIMSTNPLYASSKLPKKIDHRYFTEDVPYGVCPIAELLRLCHLQYDRFEAVAELTGIACGKDFWSEARTLASLGLQLDKKELIKYITEGI